MRHRDLPPNEERICSICKREVLFDLDLQVFMPHRTRRRVGDWCVNSSDDTFVGDDHRVGQNSQSVRAVKGGLPTLGGRR